MKMIVQAPLSKLLAEHRFCPVTVFRLLQVRLEGAQQFPAILRNRCNINVPFSVHINGQCH